MSSTDTWGLLVYHVGSTLLGAARWPDLHGGI